MGSGESKPVSYSKRKPTTSSGFLGRKRLSEGYSDVTRFYEINQRNLGKEEVRRCGIEGRNRRLYYEGQIDMEEFEDLEKTRTILRAARSFIPDAEDDGADMTNAVFILSQPSRDFVIKAGDGDWEYIFEEEADGEIYGRCVRVPFFRYLYRKGKGVFCRFVKSLIGLIPIVGPSLLALTEN